MSLYLVPTQAGLPIPQDCRALIEAEIPKRNRSYKVIHQITLENCNEGIVGIYTDNDGRYYRVPREMVLAVKENFSGDAHTEVEKVAALNRLILEILSQPGQFQLKVHIPQSSAGMTDAAKRTFAPAMDQNGMVLKDILVCYPRAQNAAFFVGVGVPKQEAPEQPMGRI